jgi:hypothetical protein
MPELVETYCLAALDDQLVQLEELADHCLSLQDKRSASHFASAMYLHKPLQLPSVLTSQYMKMHPQRDAAVPPQWTMRTSSPQNLTFNICNSLSPLCISSCVFLSS